MTTNMIQGSSAASPQLHKKPSELSQNLANQLNYLFDALQSTKGYDAATYNHQKDQLIDLMKKLEEFDPDHYNFSALKDFSLYSKDELKELAKLCEDPLAQKALESAAELVRIEGQRENSLSRFAPKKPKEEAKPPREAEHPFGAICQLQSAVDMEHLRNIRKHEISMSEVEKQLSRLNALVTELGTYIDLDSKVPRDLSAMKPQIEVLQDAWEQMAEKSPDRYKIEECPIPRGTDLTKIENKDLFKFQERARNFILRLQESSKLTVLELQTLISLYELVVKITTSMAEEVSKFLRHVLMNSRGS